MHVTTHIEGHKDDDLLDRKGGTGWPYIVFMDANGDVITEADGRSVEDFRKTGAKIVKLGELRKKAAAGDEAAVIELALLEGELGLAKYAEVEKRLAGKTLTDAQKATLTELHANSAVKDVLESLTPGGGEDALRAATEKLLALKKEGLAPTSPQLRFPFYNLLLRYGMMEKDPDLATDALNELKKMVPMEDAGMAAKVRAIEDQIEEMRHPEKSCGPDDEEGCGEDMEEDDDGCGEEDDDDGDG